MIVSMYSKKENYLNLGMYKAYRLNIGGFTPAYMYMFLSSLAATLCFSFKEYSVHVHFREIQRLRMVAAKNTYTHCHCWPMFSLGYFICILYIAAKKTYPLSLLTNVLV